MCCPVVKTMPARKRDPRAPRSCWRPDMSAAVARWFALISKARTCPSSNSATRSTSVPSLVRQCPRVTCSSSQDACLRSSLLVPAAIRALARPVPLGWLRVSGEFREASLCLSLRFGLRLVMAVERFVGVEEARPVLGKLAEEAASGDEVWLTKRGKPLAVLLSRDAYAQLRQAAAQAGRDELAARVAEARRRVAEAGLDPQIVDEAVDAARRSA